MGLWIAVPESDDGIWFDEPIGADTEKQAHEMAVTRWGGKLPADIAIIVYQCSQRGQVVLPQTPERAPRK